MRSRSFSPAPVNDIREFVAWLSLKHLAPSTIATYVAGVAFNHKIQDWPDPSRDFILSKLLEGCRRGGPSFDERTPMTLQVLSRAVLALSHTCLSYFKVALFRVVMLCAFFRSRVPC